MILTYSRFFLRRKGTFVDLLLIIICFVLYAIGFTYTQKNPDFSILYFYNVSVFCVLLIPLYFFWTYWGVTLYQRSSLLLQFRDRQDWVLGYVRVAILESTFFVVCSSIIGWASILITPNVLNDNSSMLLALLLLCVLFFNCSLLSYLMILLTRKSYLSLFVVLAYGAWDTAGTWFNPDHWPYVSIGQITSSLSWLEQPFPSFFSRLLVLGGTALLLLILCLLAAYRLDFLERRQEEE